MAHDDNNSTTIRGSNPQLLVEKITRTKIYDAPYYKEFCFGLTAETLIDRAVELEYIGGTYGGLRMPCPFLCLLFRMLQITPDADIVLEYIKDDSFKYLRALGAMYLRLTGRGVEVYRHLEPLYTDYRRLRYRHTDGSFAIIHMDEFIDSLLTENLVCDITLPFLPKRAVLESSGELPRRQSSLEDTLEAELAQEMAEEEENEENENKTRQSKHESYDERDRKHRKSRSSTSRYDDPNNNRRGEGSPSYRDRHRYGRRHDYEHHHHHHYHRSDRRDRRDHDHHHHHHHHRDDRRRYNDKHRKGKEKTHKRDKKRSGEETMSVDETNKLRIELGLPPLKE